MKYINLFDTQAAYDEAQKYYPNVSYIEATDEVVYQETDPGPDYSKEYLTFEALESGTFTLTVPAAVNSTYMTSISYSVDDGANWVTTTIDNTDQTITTPTINAGDKVLWKGEGKTLSFWDNNTEISKFSSTGNYNVSGNIMSLLYGDNFQNQTTLPTYTGNNGRHFTKLWKNSKIVSAANLILPATTLSQRCYYSMFGDSKSLTTAPELPATTLALYCYQYMLSGCTSLTTVPSDLLPATTLTNNCYNSMFQSCTALTTAPVLPATTLANSCYQYMFQNCTNLSSITMLATDISASNALSSWVSGVAATGTFTKAASMTTLPTGASGIPSGWTVVDATA